MLSNKDFQQPLQIDPIGIGQVKAITQLVNRIFSSDPNKEELEGSFAGLISPESVENPVQNNKLTEGYLILISNQDPNNPFWSNFDETQLNYDGTTLKYAGSEVTLTHIIYSIQFDQYRGPNENSAWAKKHQSAMDKLDELLGELESDKKVAIKKAALDEWRVGNLLLDNDPTYTRIEKKFLKLKKYREMLHFIKSNESNLLADPTTIKTAEQLLVVSFTPSEENVFEVTRGESNTNGDKGVMDKLFEKLDDSCLLYTSPSPRDQRGSRMPSSA